MESFNLPLYAPSVDEVKAVIEQSELFDVDHVQLFETNWDPEDNTDGDDAVADGGRSGVTSPGPCGP